MKTILEVSLWDIPVGAAIWDTTIGCGRFEFDPSFSQTGLDIAPLHMSLEYQLQGTRNFAFPENKNNTLHGLPGLLADSLPDFFGNQVINAWLRQQNKSVESFTPIDHLCYVGKRGMGALEFEPTINEAIMDVSSMIEVDALKRLSNEVLNQRENFQALFSEDEKLMLDLLKVGTSAGGAKPKAIIAYNDQTKEIRSGQVTAPAGFSYWLLKFDGVKTLHPSGTTQDQAQNNSSGLGCVEYAYHLMANDSGIQMTDCRLLECDGSLNFMTKRFDRSDLGDKYHIQTLAALAHYNRDLPHAYEDGFAVIRKLNLGYDTTEQFYRRMVFNVLSRNHDDHTKNHAFIMDRSGQWNLTPAYDLCYSYSPGGRWTNDHQMSINGKQSNFTLDDLIVVGKNMDVRQPKIIVDQIRDVISNWRMYAKEAHVHASHITQIESNLLFHKIGTPLLQAGLKEVSK